MLVNKENFSKTLEMLKKFLIILIKAGLGYLSKLDFI